MNTIYLLARKDSRDYAIVSNTGQYSWWCRSIEKAWDGFNRGTIGTEFTTIEDLINRHKKDNWRVIETFTSDTHPEYFI
ncbi:MAG: hypothetical protein PVF17_04510 [Ignavibacteria bacterium]|jgi:hypothetical protein